MTRPKHRTLGRRSKREVDVLVVGGGIAGLLTATLVQELGYKTVLLEAGPKLGSGASLRNEGWIHAGTYHSQAILDEVSARGVTRSTLVGHRYFLREALEDGSSLYARSFAVTAERLRVPFIEDRWKRFSVVHEGIALGDLAALFPGLNVGAIAGAYAVDDFAVDTTRVFARFRRRFVNAGGRVFCDAHITHQSCGTITASIGGQMHAFRPRKVVVTAGTGIGELCQRVWGITIEQRFFKSHLVIAGPVRQQHSIFSLDDRGPTIMVHSSGLDLSRARYLIGLNRVSRRLEVPEVEADKSEIDEIVAKAEDLMGSRLEFVSGYACVKTELAPRDREGGYDLQLRILQLASDLIVAVPGKMTEAPTLALAICNLIHQELQADDIAKRPMDDILQAAIL